MGTMRYLVAFIGIVLLSLSLNLLLDSSNCIVGYCLTKKSAFHEVHVGMSSAELTSVLHRAGVSADSPEAGLCGVVMFSDFWRDYVIQRETKTGMVVRKSFAFRQHGEGLLEVLRLAR